MNYNLKYITNYSLISDFNYFNFFHGHRFSCASNLNSHIRNIHENTNGYVCHICAKMLRTKTLLRFHSDTHLPSQRLKCNHVTCNVVLKSKKTLYAHLKQHQQQEEQICGICKKVCQNTRALKSHLRNVHSAATHRCSFCDKAFKLRRYLEVSNCGWG